MSTLPPFLELPSTPEPPRRRKSVRTAVLLTVLFGPLGLFYVSPFAGLLMTFVTGVAGLFTVGIGLFLAWPVCILWAVAATTGHHEEGDGSTAATPPAPPA
ncbi:MAG: hypothetical protein JO040_05745 [Gemmatimonadetes bacterium]|nr:hypothetical protein [Gemmatimonadota bacterium]